MDRINVSELLGTLYRKVRIILSSFLCVLHFFVNQENMSTMTSFTFSLLHSLKSIIGITSNYAGETTWEIYFKDIFIFLSETWEHVFLSVIAFVLLTLRLTQFLEEIPCFSNISLVSEKIPHALAPSSSDGKCISKKWHITFLDLLTSKGFQMDWFNFSMPASLESSERIDKFYNVVQYTTTVQCSANNLNFIQSKRKINNLFISFSLLSTVSHKSFFCKKTIFCLSLYLLNIMLEIKLRFS